MTIPKIKPIITKTGLEFNLLSSQIPPITPRKMQIPTYHPKPTSLKAASHLFIPSGSITNPFLYTAWQYNKSACSGQAPVQMKKEIISVIEKPYRKFCRAYYQIRFKLPLQDL